MENFYIVSVVYLLPTLVLCIGVVYSFYLIHNLKIRDYVVSLGLLAFGAIPFLNIIGIYVLYKYLQNYRPAILKEWNQILSKEL